MKLQPEKNAKTLLALFAQAREHHIEQDASGNVTRVTFGPLNKPLAIVMKPNDYQHHFEVSAPKTKKQYTSSAIVFGSPITTTKDSEHELGAWENEIRSSCGSEVVFTHSEEIVPDED